MRARRGGAPPLRGLDPAREMCSSCRRSAMSVARAGLPHSIPRSIRRAQLPAPEANQHRGRRCSGTTPVSRASREGQARTADSVMPGLHAAGSRGPSCRLVGSTCPLEAGSQTLHRHSRRKRSLPKIPRDAPQRHGAQWESWRSERAQSSSAAARRRGSSNRNRARPLRGRDPRLR